MECLTDMLSCRSGRPDWNAANRATGITHPASLAATGKPTIEYQNQAVDDLVVPIAGRK